MNIEIKASELENLEEILKLYSQPDMDNGPVLNTEEARKIYNRILTYPNYKIFIGLCNQEIVGTFALAIMDNLAHRGAPSGLIEDVVVKAEWQGKGIGKQMMQYAINYCRECGCYKVSLSSNLKRENAHKFYESLGFKKHGYSFSTEL